MTCRMTELMERGTMPIDPLEIRLWRRDLYVVFHRGVERSIAADTKIDVRGLDQRLDPGFDQI